MAPRYQLQRTIGHNSSPVTKGRRMFVDELADGRSAWARRWNDLVLMHAADLGGYDMLSEAQISICKRVATLECELESMEGRMSAGIPVDIELYARLTGRLCRLLEMIGIKRLKPSDAFTELARAFEGYPPKPPPPDDDEDEDDDDDDDDGVDEPAAIEEGPDKSEPGKA